VVIPVIPVPQEERVPKVLLVIEKTREIRVRQDLPDLQDRRVIRAKVEILEKLDRQDQLDLRDLLAKPEILEKQDRQDRQAQQD